MAKESNVAPADGTRGDSSRIGGLRGKRGRHSRALLLGYCKDSGSKQETWCEEAIFQINYKDTTKGIC